MADAEGAALGGQCVQHMGKDTELLPRVRLIVCAVHIRDGEMGENTLRVQPRQGAGLCDGLHAGFKMLAPDQKAQPGHTGIHLDVDPQRAAALHSLGAVRLRLGLGGHRLSDVVFDELGHHLRRGVPQDQNGHGNAAVAQFPALVQTGHCQIVRPQLFQLPGHLHRAVAVGVRLHHAQILHAGANLLPGHIVVVFQSIQVDFRPGAP